MNCHSCHTQDGREVADCTTCKLAFLNERKSKDDRHPDDDYSISSRLTGRRAPEDMSSSTKDAEGNGNLPIAYLVAAAVGVLFFVLLFAKLLS